MVVLLVEVVVVPVMGHGGGGAGGGHGAGGGGAGGGGVGGGGVGAGGGHGGGGGDGGHGGGGGGGGRGGGVGGGGCRDGGGAGGGGGDVTRQGPCNAFCLPRRTHGAVEAAVLVHQRHRLSQEERGSLAGSELLFGPRASVMHLTYVTFHILFLCNLKESHL